MKDLRINVGLFRNKQSAKGFVDVIRETLKGANGNLVPIFNDGKLLGYAVPSDSPYWKDVVTKHL